MTSTQERARAIVREINQAGGCSHPIRIQGETVNVATGELRRGTLKIPCKDRRAALCPSCSSLYATDAWILVATGLNGGKGVPEGVQAIRGSSPRSRLPRSAQCTPRAPGLADAIRGQRTGAAATASPTGVTRPPPRRRTSRWATVHGMLRPRGGGALERDGAAALGPHHGQAPTPACSRSRPHDDRARTRRPDPLPEGRRAPATWPRALPRAASSRRQRRSRKQPT